MKSEHKAKYTNTRIAPIKIGEDRFHNLLKQSRFIRSTTKIQKSTNPSTVFEYNESFKNLATLPETVHCNRKGFRCTSKNYVNIISNNLKSKYISTRILEGAENAYNVKIINDILSNEPKHLVAVFKDYLMRDDPSEFFRRFYNIEESDQKVKTYIMYQYKNTIVFPNYFLLNARSFLFKNIRKKQKLIDKLNDQIENVKDNNKVLTTKFMEELNRSDSILGQTLKRLNDNTSLQFYINSKGVQAMNLQELLEKAVLDASNSHVQNDLVVKVGDCKNVKPRDNNMQKVKGRENEMVSKRNSLPNEKKLLFSEQNLRPKYSSKCLVQLKGKIALTQKQKILNLAVSPTRKTQSKNNKLTNSLSTKRQSNHRKSVSKEREKSLSIGKMRLSARPMHKRVNSQANILERKNSLNQIENLKKLKKFTYRSTKNLIIDIDKLIQKTRPKLFKTNTTKGNLGVKFKSNYLNSLKKRQKKENEGRLRTMPTDLIGANTLSSKNISKVHKRGGRTFKNRRKSNVDNAPRYYAI